jgi:hypothetical protein
MNVTQKIQQLLNGLKAQYTESWKMKGKRGEDSYDLLLKDLILQTEIQLEIEKDIDYDKSRHRCD